LRNGFFGRAKRKPLGTTGRAGGVAGEGFVKELRPQSKENQRGDYSQGHVLRIAVRPPHISGRLCPEAFCSWRNTTDEKD